MRTVDFHGWKSDDALQAVDRVVGEIRLSGQPETVVFITGHGVIKYEIRDLLQMTYKIEIFSPLTSPSITVTIE